MDTPKRRFELSRNNDTLARLEYLAEILLFSLSFLTKYMRQVFCPQMHGAFVLVIRYKEK